MSKHTSENSTVKTSHSLSFHRQSSRTILENNYIIGIPKITSLKITFQEIDSWMNVSKTIKKTFIKAETTKLLFQRDNRI